jgi:hypothetical protein
MPFYRSKSVSYPTPSTSDELRKPSLYEILHAVTFCSLKVKVKAKAKLSVCTPRRHLWGAEVQLHSFITSATYGGERSPSSYVKFSFEPPAFKHALSTEVKTASAEI